MSDLPFEDQFHQWLQESLANGAPVGVVAFAFNLFEPAFDPASKFGVELVGTEAFDPDDPDWCCEEIWEPATRGLHIPSSYSGETWEHCLAKISGVIQEVLAGDSTAAQTLRSVAGVGIGFVDGDTEILWNKQG